MQMGKLSYDPKHHHNPHNQSKKAVNISVKKPVKITYISSPLLVRACDASDFRSVVQQLTGKDSSNEDLINCESSVHTKDPTLRNINQEPPTWVMQVDQGGELCATTSMPTEEDGKSSFYYNYNIPMDCLEFDQDHFWKEVACSVKQPPSYVVL